MGCSRLLLTLLTAEIACGSACLYVPPLSRAAGAPAVESLNVQPAKTRRDVEHGLGGKAEVLRKQGVYVYDWVQSFGWLFVAGIGGGGGGEFKGRNFRALVSFDGDRVVRFERFVDKPAEGEHVELPAAAEPDRVRAGCTPKARCAWVAVAEGDRPVAVDAKGNLWTWDGDDARRLAPAPTDAGLRDFAPLLALSPDGRYAAFGRHLDTVVFDLRDEREVLHAVRPEPDWYPAAARPTVMDFTSDGSMLVVMGFDRCAQLIDAGTWKSEEVMRIHGRPLYHGAFVPSTTRLLTIDHNGDLQFFDVRTGEPEPVLVRRKSGPLHQIATAPDGRHIALVTPATVEHWDLEQLEHERDAAPAESPPTFTDGRATDALLGVQLLPFPAVRPDCRQGAVFTPDGRALAVVIGDRIGLFPANGSPAERWFTASGQSLCGAAFSRDGSRLFSTTPAGLAEWAVRSEAR